MTISTSSADLQQIETWANRHPSAKMPMDGIAHMLAVLAREVLDLRARVKELEELD